MSTPSVAPAPVIKGRALLFGLNYEGTPNELHGCVQDVVNIGAYLSRALQLPAKVCTDAKSTSAMAIVQGMYELALQSYSESLDYVWIHYSGHGSYVVDRNGDERDGPAAAFLPLAASCVTARVDKYDYRVCPFDRAEQDEAGGGGGTPSRSARGPGGARPAPRPRRPTAASPTRPPTGRCGSRAAPTAGTGRRAR